MLVISISFVAGATANKFSPEVRDRAVRMVLDQEREPPSRWAAIVSITARIGCSGQTLDEWLKKAERDTPSRLASYLENFDTRIVGLTGSDEQITHAAKAYRVYYSPVEHEKSGTDIVGHSTFVYLMNPTGKFDALLPSDVDTDKLTTTLRAKLDATPG